LKNNSPSSSQKTPEQNNINGTNNTKSKVISESDIDIEGLLVPLRRKYKFKRRLGIGNFARVYLVEQIHLQKEFALKILDFNYILQVLERNHSENIAGEFSKIKKRFINEARVIKDIKHPSIVEIDDLDVIPEESKNIDVPYLTMNYIKGTTLKEKIEKEGPLDLESALRISGDILSALKVIHGRDIIHRDIKPDNIIIEEGTGKAILVDFGIAKDFSSNSKLTIMGSLLGTPLYMAPEQIDYSHKLSSAADIYSFGVVLFEMLTGKPPYDESDVLSKHRKAPVPDIRKRSKELPEGIEKIIEKAIAKAPENRYQDSEEFMQALKKLASKTEIEYEDSDLEEVKKEIHKEYKIEKKLNRGGFAKIYLVRHRQLDDLRVLKVMRHSYLLNEKGENHVGEFKERFEREGKLLAKIKHENIVKIHDIGKSGKSKIPYLIMEYIKGKSLDELLKKGKPLDIKKALNTAGDILSALDIMHTGQGKPIIHRDIKPSNIMIEDKTGKAILIDLGIAKDKLARSDLTIIGSSIGTPAYMSPEQCKGIIDLGPAADIYSLGVVLFEMLTGEVPFKSDNNDPIKVMYAHSYIPVPNVRDINSNLPDGIEQIIFKAMAKSPADRYKSAADFLSELNKIKNSDKYKTDNNKKRKFFKNFLWVFIPLIIVAAIIVGYILIKSHGTGAERQYRELMNSANQSIETGDYEQAGNYLNQALKIKDTRESRWLLEMVEKKQKEKENMIRDRLQIEKMKGDYQKLQADLKGSAPGNKKIEMCRAFLKTYKEIPANAQTRDMISEIQGSLNKYESEMKAEIDKEKQYQGHIKSVEYYINRGNYAKAAEFLQQAKQVNDTPEVKQLSKKIETKKREEQERLEEKKKKRDEYERKNGTRDYNAIRESINLKKYREFKARYPGSIHLADLKEKLKSADKVLPPEKYWDKKIEKNGKGYYELEFGPEHNDHRMIYIPGKNFWIDKYEVSNLQFRQFLKAEHRASASQTGKDEYPAVVEYEEAESYCRKYGFKLPTETEWEYAANGGKDIAYPWGNEKPDENGIYRANFDSFDDGFMAPAPVKSFEKFSSPFGIINMAGNVWEWIQGKILKGGGFVSEIEGLKIENSSTGKSGEKNGFRCLKQY
jgi:serine/threonine protein kinase